MSCSTCKPVTASMGRWLGPGLQAGYMNGDWMSLLEAELFHRFLPSVRNAVGSVPPEGAIA